MRNVAGHFITETGLTYTVYWPSKYGDIPVRVSYLNRPNEMPQVHNLHRNDALDLARILNLAANSEGS